MSFAWLRPDASYLSGVISHREVRGINTDDLNSRGVPCSPLCDSSAQLSDKRYNRTTLRQNTFQIGSALYDIVPAAMITFELKRLINPEQPKY